VGQRRVEQAVDVEVVLDELVIAGVVGAERRGHGFQLVVAAVVVLPLVARVGIANQALAAHLRRVEDMGASALGVIIVRLAATALAAAGVGRAARQQRRQVLPPRRQGRRIGRAHEEFGAGKVRRAR